MTFCKLLKEETSKSGKYKISAWENTEKFSALPHYSVVVSVDSIGIAEYATAKTTWKKKFSEAVRNW